MNRESGGAVKRAALLTQLYMFFSFKNEVYVDWNRSDVLIFPRLGNNITSIPLKLDWGNRSSG